MALAEPDVTDTGTTEPSPKLKGAAKKGGKKGTPAPKAVGKRLPNPAVADSAAKESGKGNKKKAAKDHEDDDGDEGDEEEEEEEDADEEDLTFPIAHA